MAIFDEPSREPLPQPTLEDAKYAGRKGLLSMIPLVGGVGSELIALLSSPLAQRRDAWLEDLERRLRDLEGKIDGFRFDDLGNNQQFISAAFHATQAAGKTHQSEKLAALRNAVLHVAIGSAPSEDLQLIFLNLVDSFTPTHLQALAFFQQRDSVVVARLRSQRDLTDQAVRDLRDRGLINDPRLYAARGRETLDSLVVIGWNVTNLGKQFLAFIKSPEAEKA